VSDAEFRPFEDADRDQHPNHPGMVDPFTGEVRDEASVVVDGRRIYWCGHEEDA
jgi:hypothetical protein